MLTAQMNTVLKYIETPGLELTRLLSKVRADVEEATDNKQVPWDSSSLKGDFYFNPASADDRANGGHICQGRDRSVSQL